MVKRDMDDRMFDFKNFYDTIIELLPDHCVIVEVGIANGASAIYLAEGLYNCGKSFKLFMVDNLDYGKEYQLNTIMNNIMASGLQDSIELIALDSLNASTKFDDSSLDFVYLDSSHQYAQTKAEILLWREKIKSDSILAGHDYYSIEGVANAVNETVPNVNLNETRDGHGVWWFKKQ